MNNWKKYIWEGGGGVIAKYNIIKVQEMVLKWKQEELEEKKEQINAWIDGYL